MYKKDLPLLHILSDSTIGKLALKKGWTEQYAAAWSYLYFKSKRPPKHKDVLELEPRMVKKTLEQ